jgi:hypothetical protein
MLCTVADYIDKNILCQAYNIEEELSDFSTKLPDRWPNPPDRRPDDSAIIAYNDSLFELRKNFQKEKFRKVYPPSIPKE